MYFRHMVATISILSVVVPASTIGSDFTLPSDDSTPDFTLLPFDQTALSFNQLDPPFDQTTPFLDAEIPSPDAAVGSDAQLASTDAFAGFDLPIDAENTSSDLIWNDSFELAGCSTSEGSPLPALGKSRVRRGEDSSSCVNPDGTKDKIELSLQQEKFSLTCTLLTGGVLPIAVIASTEPNDKVINLNVLNSVSTFGRGPRLYYPTTVYRATVIVDALPAALSGQEVFCCGSVQTFFLYTTGINCNELRAMLATGG